MQVTVRTFGPLSSMIGGHQLMFDASGKTVQSLLDELISRFGVPLRSYLYPRGEDLSDLLFVLVNGKNIGHLSGTATVLEEGDVVSILPITAGG